MPGRICIQARPRRKRPCISLTPCILLPCFATLSDNPFPSVATITSDETTREWRPSEATEVSTPSVLVPSIARLSILLVRSGIGDDEAVKASRAQQVVVQTSPAVTHRWQFWKDDKQGCQKVERKQDGFVLCVMGRDEEEHNRHRCEPFLGRGILRARVDLLPECQVIVSASRVDTKRGQMTADRSAYEA